jgi:ribosomal protein S27AE
VTMIRCRAPHCLEPVDSGYDVCEVCWDYRVKWRDDLPDQWDRAAHALTPGRTAMDVKVRMSRAGSSMPLRVTPLTAMAEALTRLEMWAHTLIRKGCPGFVPATGTARDSFIFVRSVLLLDLYDHTLAGGPLAGDYYLDLYKAYWRLYRVDRTGVELVRVDRPCPACGRRSVWERHAGEYVQCLTCGTEWSQASWAKIAYHRSTT